MTRRTSERGFRSPWRSRLFVAGIAAARFCLRPFPGLQERFIEGLARAQNRRVERHLQGGGSARVLLLMPRCVKKTGCRAPVRESLSHCLPCMQCALGDVAALCRDHGVQARVAFRSQEAFALARSQQPDLIIASACHDRIVKALRSTPEYPALLAPLTGMATPCRDAGVDLDWLRAQLRRLDRPPTPGSRAGAAG